MAAGEWGEIKSNWGNQFLLLQLYPSNWEKTEGIWCSGFGQNTWWIKY